MNLNSFRQRARELTAQYDLAKKFLKNEADEYRVAVQQVKDLKEAQTILQQIAQTIQQQAHEKIARVVSRCLTMVFQQPYELLIQFERKRGRTEARLQFKRGEMVLEDPMEESGGGVIDVAAFAMRLASLMLSRPSARRLIIMDEPFKFVSEEFLPNVRQMLETLAEEMEVQIVMVTHIEELQVGKVIRIK